MATVSSVRMSMTLVVLSMSLLTQSSPVARLPHMWKTPAPAAAMPSTAKVPASKATTRLLARSPTNTRRWIGE